MPGAPSGLRGPARPAQRAGVAPASLREARAAEAGAGGPGPALVCSPRRRPGRPAASGVGRPGGGEGGGSGARAPGQARWRASERRRRLGEGRSGAGPRRCPPQRRRRRSELDAGGPALAPSRPGGLRPTRRRALWARAPIPAPERGPARPREAGAPARERAGAPWAPANLPPPGFPQPRLPGLGAAPRTKKEKALCWGSLIHHRTTLVSVLMGIVVQWHEAWKHQRRSEEGTVAAGSPGARSTEAFLSLSVGPAEHTARGLGHMAQIRGASRCPPPPTACAER
nr:translation initiation factor IF-2-like [Equus asinus]